jgi:diguanylate cyclase (GGDEF)-like protein
MIDIDNFKAVNDTYGHSVGDEVIREVAARLYGVLREGDLICRYGGEEFALLLADIDIEGATHVADRLLTAVNAVPITTQAGDLRVTVSVGVARYSPSGDLHSLLNSADQSLYAAKRAGRNRVVAA